MMFCEDVGSPLYGDIHLFQIDNERDVSEIKSQEWDSRLSVSIPQRFKTNKEKTIYKVGYLLKFLRKLYPEETTVEIVRIMNDRYQVFLGRRQIERYAKTYQEEKKYH